MGISYVPADRRHVGSVTEMSVADNAILGLQRKYTRGLFRRIREARESARGLVARFGIRSAGIDFAAGKLSGGNLQKLILGREIMRGSAALIVEHPRAAWMSARWKRCGGNCCARGKKARRSC